MNENNQTENGETFVTPSWLVDFAKNILAEAETSTDVDVRCPSVRCPNPFYTFYGLELHRFAIPGGSVKLIGRRNRGDMPHQIYEIEVCRENGIFPNRAEVVRDGKRVFVIETQANFNRCEHMAISALHRLLRDQHLDCNHKSRRAKKNGGEA